MTSPSAHQLVQFDWRLITTVGCSSASVIPRSEPAGMPLLQLQFDTANRSQLASQEVETKNYFTKFPSSPEINNGLRPADDTLLWELNVTEVEELISRLQGALTIADKVCTPPHIVQ
eukprot:GILI01038099.1.p1 GENE.GILI01038099.1~~GILI01038099.1.p1  ORF type:complete len:137 (-),score=16.79 GILI01038099.1:87-437(-)